MNIKNKSEIIKLLGGGDFFQNDHFRLVDIGARGGVKRHWTAFSPALHVIGFEPHENEADRLKIDQNDEAAFEVYGYGLWSEDSIKNLNINYNPSSSTVYQIDSDFSNRLVVRENLNTVETYSVSLKPFDSFNIESVDFIDVDAEGAEFCIFKGASSAIKNPGTLGFFQRSDSMKDLDHQYSQILINSYVAMDLVFMI